MVGVEEHDDVGRIRGQVREACEACAPVTAPRFDDDLRARAARDLSGAVARAVVDDDDAHAVWDFAEDEREARGFVERGDHGSEAHGGERTASGGRCKGL
jgi:hypothetical protein